MQLEAEIIDPEIIRLGAEAENQIRTAASGLSLILAATALTHLRPTDRP